MLSHINMHKYIETHIYPLFYFLFWLAVHFLIFGYNMLFYSIYISLTYGTGHYLSAQKGKITLCSDGLAMPLTALAGIIYAAISWYLGHFPSDPEIAKHNIAAFIKAFTFSSIGAHVFLLLLVLLYDKFLVTPK